MIRCERCKNLFDNDEVRTIEALDDGYRYVEAVECPFCGSDELEEVVECTDCGEWFKENELHGYRRCRCHECLKAEATLVEAIWFGEYNKKAWGFKTNEFYSYLVEANKDRGPFSTEELDKIAEEYCMMDEDTFATYLEEKEAC